MNKVYSEEYDAYYDANTGQWLEDACTDPACEYCTERPPINTTWNNWKPIKDIT